MPFDPSVGFSPWHLSGVVYGTLLNDPASLAALGAAVEKPPYKAPPQAPVLYLKPRNTLSGPGSVINVPAAATSVRVGVSLGIIIGRTACRVPANAADNFIAGYTVVNDICLPHDNFYRPSLRFNARDGFCPIANARIAAALVSDPDALATRVWIDDEPVFEGSTGGRIRSVRRLLADVTEFMTLQPGDILLLGASAGAPLAADGQRIRVEISGIGSMENRVEREESR